MQTIAVVGLGFMGRGIVQALAQAGYRVQMISRDLDKARKIKEQIESTIEKDISKGRINNDVKDKALALMYPSGDIEDAAEAQLVIEAIPEDKALKKELFERLHLGCPGEVIFGTNTSTLPVTELAAHSGRPDRFIGIHFFFPIPYNPLVELVPAHQTSTATRELGEKLVQSLGKEFIIARPYPAFIVNRIIFAVMNEALWLLWEGNKPEDVDKALKLSMQWPLGPLEMIDHIGLDVALNAQQSIYYEFQDPRYRVCPLLKEYVAAGRLGIKSGKGIYDYQK